MRKNCVLLVCAVVVLALNAKGNCEGKVTNKRSVLYGDEYDAFGNKCWGSCLSTISNGYNGQGFSNLNGLNFASNVVYASGLGTYANGQLLGVNNVGTGVNTHTHSIHTITKAVPVPQPYPITVTKHVPVNVPQPYPVEVHKHVPVEVKVPVEVPKPYPVKITERIAYPVEKPVYVPITVTRNVPVKVPVEVPKPYPVKVTEHVPYPVERNVYVKIPEPVIVRQPYPVNVPTTVFVKDGSGSYATGSSISLGSGLDNNNLQFTVRQGSRGINDFGLNGYSVGSEFGSSGLSAGQIQSFSGTSGTYTGTYIPSSLGGLRGKW